MQKSVESGSLKENLKQMNWHLTETEGGSWSVGTTKDHEGFYPANAETGASADAWVAPGKYITSYLEARGEEPNDQAIREAILAWRRGDAAELTHEAQQYAADRRKAMEKLGYSQEEMLSFSQDQEDEVLETEIERIQLARLLGDEDNEGETLFIREGHSVYVKRTNGSFSPLRYITNIYGGFAEVHYDDHLKKRVEIADLFDWQKEAAEWRANISLEQDKERDIVFDSILKEAEEAKVALEHIGATSIKQVLSEREGTRYVIIENAQEREPDVRKHIKISFSVDSQTYTLSGYTANTYDRQCGGSGYHAEWTVFQEGKGMIAKSDTYSALNSLREAGITK
jgi:hypothetical protein